MGTENVGLAPRYQDKPSSCWEQFLEPGEPQPAGSQHGEAPEGWRCCSGVRAGSESRTWPQGNIYSAGT